MNLSSGMSRNQVSSRDEKLKQNRALDRGNTARQSTIPSQSSAAKRVKWQERTFKTRRYRTPSIGNLLIVLLLIILLAWAFIPGLGPNLANLNSENFSLGSRNAEETLASAPQTDLVLAIRDLPVAEWDQSKKYRRAAFGPAWTDVDHNGCDTRNDILNRDLGRKTYKSADKCIVTSGYLVDPYLGKPIEFQRGSASSAKVQIDHVVALGNAWKTGAAHWTDRQRLQFANDPLNLLSVAGEANQQKSDQDAADWLPDNPQYRCRYVSLQVQVKQKYHLWVRAAEKQALAEVAATCPQQ